MNPSTAHQPASAASIRALIYCALFTALIIVGSYISIPIPISPVPIALADFFIMLCALFLGPKYGLASVALFIGLGAIGLPVFTGGKAGLAVLVGPTGGFIVGYLFMVVIIGAITQRRKPTIPVTGLALLAGNTALYAFGIAWLKVFLNAPWEAAIAAGLLPFLPGLAIKIAAACVLARAMLPNFRKRNEGVFCKQSTTNLANPQRKTGSVCAPTLETACSATSPSYSNATSDAASNVASVALPHKIPRNSRDSSNASHNETPTTSCQEQV